MYDLSEPAVLAVDDHGVVFQSQCSSSSTVQPTAMCTQESRNVSKGKLKVVVEEEALLEEGYKSTHISQGAYDSDNNPFCMEKYRIGEDTEIIEGKRLAEEEDEYEDEASDEESEEVSEDDTVANGRLKEENAVHIKDIRCPLPPGIWRKGRNYMDSRNIFLRFATRSDKKQPQIEKKGEYYKKHGN